MSGGKRPGAGRPSGSRNKRTVALEKQTQSIVAAAGISPLEYMLAVMRDENGNPEMRLEAARHAAPYVHPKLSSIEMSGKDGSPLIIHITPDDDNL